MKPNQNARQNRQGRPNQYSNNQHNNQKRAGKGRHSPNRNPQPNTPNRQMDSRGPAGNLRGNAKQLYEKYKTLAQEKRLSNRLESESFNQHADHYYRIFAEFAAEEAAKELRREQEQTRKAEAEAERRVNSAPKEERDSQNRDNRRAENIRKPELQESKPAKSDNEDGGRARDVDAPATKPPEKVLPENTAEEKPASKKRRGRPPKVKTTENTDAEGGTTA